MPSSWSDSRSDCATAQRSPLVAMANRADLTTRVRAVLDVRQRRRRAGVFSLTSRRYFGDGAASSRCRPSCWLAHRKPLLRR